MAVTDDASPTTAIGELSVSIRGLDVKYRVYEEQRLSVRELVGRGFRDRRSVEVHAIRDLDLDIYVGEALGLLGANGSGKSTLLRAVAGLQSKSAGTVLVRGEPHLLGVNAALKPRLSGYRNILLGGLAMGLSQSEIQDRMAEVIEFSGLGDAISRPMDTYSSGMRARLSFSIATLRIPDILLIDEALAVGDRDFRDRSLARINEIREQANTVVMVTHNLDEIRRTCNRAVWLDDGVIRADGAVDDVLARYESSGTP